MRVLLVLRRQLHDDPVFVRGRVDRGDPSLAIRGVKRVFDLLGSGAQCQSPVPVNIQIDLRAFDLQICGHVNELRQSPHLGVHNLRVFVELIRIRAHKRVLVQTLRQLAANANGRWILQIHAQARNRI